MESAADALSQYTPPLLQLTNERRWFLQFFVGILLCINNGACFCFALFSDRFRYEPFHFSQSQINGIATIGIITSYFSLPTGFLYDKKGPTPTLLVGALFSFSGWLGLSYVFRASDSSPRSFISVLFFYGLSQLSANFFETGTILTNLKCFSCYQGRVVMIQKTYMGLGTSILAQIYFIFFQNFESMTPFFLFLCLYSGVVGILSFLVVHLPKPSTLCLGLNVTDPKTLLGGQGESMMFRKPFNIGTAVLLFSIIAFLVMSLVENFYQVPLCVLIVFGFVTISSSFLFLFMYSSTPNYTCNIGGYKDTNPEAIEEELEYISSTILADKNVLPSTSISPHTNLSNDGNIHATTENMRFVFFFFPRIIKNWTLNKETLWANIQKRDIWLLWYTCFASWSAMTLVSSNCTEIYSSAAQGTFSQAVNSAYVSIFGVASAFGRVTVGILHPFILQYQIGITCLCCAAPLINTVGILLFLVVRPVFLFFPFFLSGLSTGISWGSAILIVTSLFTEDNRGKHYSFLHSAGMLSAIIINTAIFGPIYDHFTKVQGLENERMCEGLICIIIPVLICFFLNLLAIPASLYFVWRTISHSGI